MTLVHRAMLELSSIRGGALTPVFGILIDTALKGSLLIVAAAIVAYLLRGRSASARHAAWSAAVIGHLALPVLTLLAPQWRLPVLPTPPWLAPAAVAPVAQSTIATPGASQSQSTGLFVSPATPVVANRAASNISPAPAAPSPKPHTRWPLISLLGLAWLLGGLLVLARLAFGTWRVGRLAK